MLTIYQCSVKLYSKVVLRMCILASKSPLAYVQVQLSFCLASIGCSGETLTTLFWFNLI